MFRLFQLLMMVIGVLTWTLVGQGVLALLIWPNRHQNAIYRLFTWITWPVWRVARVISPRFISDSQVGFVALFLLIALRLAVYSFFYSQGWIPTVTVPPAQ